MCAAHQTTVVSGNSQPINAIILVGPPASGKSTIRNMFGDFGASTADLEQAHEQGTTLGDWKSIIDTAISDAHKSDSKLCCIDSAISGAEVEYIRDQTEHCLVIQVSVEYDQTRVDRYIERQLNEQNKTRESVDQTKIDKLLQKIHTRHMAESPYPIHDVTIDNSVETHVTDLISTIGRLTCILSEIDEDDVEFPTVS